MKEGPALKEDLGVVGEEKLTEGSPVFTSIQAKILELFELCRLMGCQAAITGDSGIGKSDIAEKYTEKRSVDTTLITLGVAVSCVGTLLELIANELHLPYGRSKRELSDRIVERLRYSSRLFIFDESHFLTWQMFEALRYIHDESGVPIVYLGQPRLYSQMKGKGGLFLYDQIVGRLGIRKNFKGTVSKGDVKLVAQSLHRGLDKKTLDFLHKRCQAGGKFRRMIYVLDVCKELSRREGAPIDFSLVSREAKSLGL